MMNTTSKRRGLGQGLAALFDDLEAPENKEPTVPNQAIQEIVFLSPQQIKTGQYQPRKHFDQTDLEQLATSIKEKGILHPLVVRKNEDGDIELIAGERRLRAATKIGLKALPCRILPMTSSQAFEISLLENIQRADLSAMEEAAGYQQLIDERSYTQESLATKIGKSRAHIANMLRLLKLPASVQTAIDSKRLSAGHGRALVGHPQCESLSKKAMKEGWSVRQTEEAVAIGMHRQSNASKKTATSSAQLPLEERPLKEEEALAQQLTSLLKLPVDISLKRNGGEIRIQFPNSQTLDALLQKLTETFSEKPEDHTTIKDWTKEQAFILQDSDPQK